MQPGFARACEDPCAKGSEAHRLQHAERIRGIGTVRCQTDVDASVQYRPDMCNTGSEPEIAGRYVGNGAAMFGEQIEIVLVDPHAMCCDEARPEHPKIGKIADRGTVIDLASDDSLQAGRRGLYPGLNFLTICAMRSFPQATSGSRRREPGHAGDR